MKNVARLSVLSLLAVVVLSGCLRMSVDLTLQPDNTVDGTMVIAVEEGIGETLGMSDAELVEQITSGAGEGLEDATQEPYNEGGYVGTKLTFAGQSLDEAASEVGSDSLSITREGDTFIVDGPFESGAVDTAEIPAGAEMTFSVTFPGAVTDHNGTLSGTTVTWDLTNPPAKLHAEGGATTSSGTPTWIFIALAVAVVLGLIAVIAWFAFRDRSRSLAAAEDAPVADAVASEATFAAEASAPAVDAVPEPVVAEPVVEVAPEPVAAEPVVAEPAAAPAKPAAKKPATARKPAAKPAAKKPAAKAAPATSAAKPAAASAKKPAAKKPAAKAAPATSAAKPATASAKKPAAKKPAAKKPAAKPATASAAKPPAKPRAKAKPSAEAPQEPEST